MTEKESLLPKNGGFRKLKSFQIAQLSYDVTVRCMRGAKEMDLMDDMTRMDRKNPTQPLPGPPCP